MNESRIDIRGLSVLYEGNLALKNVSVGFPDRQITAIIGPSGCGKTTLLRSINRLIDLNDGVKVSGEIRVDGRDILDTKADVTAIRKKIGLVSQKPCPLPMSIYDNVAYGPRIHGMKDKKALDKVVQDCLQTANLWDEVKDRLRSPATKLSVGQQQRLCLARSLAVHPEILLCDEPTSALDPISAEEIEQTLIKLKSEYTVVIVTHNIHQAMRLADYVVHLYLGEVVEHGPAQEVFESPKEERTRAYVNGTSFGGAKTETELSLKGTRCPLNFVYFKQALRGLQKGTILKVIVDDPVSVVELPKGVTADGQALLGVKQVNDTDWEIRVQKVG